jgi:Xaa-Pro aminopeptidase
MERLRGLVRLDRPLLVRVPEHIYYLTGHEPLRDAPAALVIDKTHVHGLWADAVPDGLPPWVESETYAVWPSDETAAAHGLGEGVARLCPGAATDDALEGRAPFRQLMRRKSHAEIAAVERNLLANDAAFAAIAETLRAGTTDHDVFAAGLLALAREAGGPVAWDGCIGLGSHGDDLEAQPCGAIAADGDVAFVDLYPRRHHYAGDSSRAFAIGRAPAWAEPLHALLVEALEAVERLLHPGASAATLDAACRGILDGNRAGAVFPHHTGHGLGVFAQEAPFLVPGSTDVLAVGDIVAVEPGLYRPGVGGMRLEDAWEITPDGPRRLNAFPRELTVCR